MTSIDIAIRLLGEIRDHMSIHQIEAVIDSVQAVACDGGIIAVRLTHNDLPVVAAGLLAWADTLTNVSVAGWRFRYGDNVALRLIGELPNANATWIEIFGAFSYTDTIATTIGPEVHRDTHLHLTLDDLRSWAVAP
jgi:hypothetical protein